MKKLTFRRKSRYFDGTEITSRELSDLMPSVLEQITETFNDRPDLVLAAWPDVIGVRLAPMAQAVSFNEGVLTVKVSNSSLYSLLIQKDKPKLIQALRQKFPKTQIKTILFRIG